MSKKELLFSLTKKDFKVTYFSGKGAGGQHRNKHQNCVRISHEESGVTAVGTSHKSRIRNRKDAFKRLTSHEKFKSWIKLKAGRMSLDLDKLNEKVDRMMDSENLKIEYFNGKVWSASRI